MIPAFEGAAPRPPPKPHTYTNDIMCYSSETGSVQNTRTTPEEYRPQARWVYITAELIRRARQNYRRNPGMGSPPHVNIIKLVGRRFFGMDTPYADAPFTLRDSVDTETGRWVIRESDWDLVDERTRKFDINLACEPFSLVFEEIN